MIRIRIFGSQDCKNCKKLLDGLNKHGVSYAFVDAMAEETQDFCDRHGVNVLPHVQIVDASGSVLFEQVGLASPYNVIDAIKKLKKKKKKN